MKDSRVILAVLLVTHAAGFMCSSLNIGTDIKNTKDIVNSGVIQASWGKSPTKKFPPTVSEFYLYVEGLSHLAPEFREMEFHHQDEDAEMMHTWLKMNVTEDDEDVGLLDKITVYKVTQECLERDGGHTLLLNVTFTASTCDPITVSWYKICGEPSQASKGFFVGFSKSSKEVAADGVVTEMFDGNTEDDIHKVPYDEDETVFYIYSKSDTPVFMNAPFVIADHEVLYPALNGTAAAGGWVTSDPWELTVIYNCIKEKGTKEELVLVLELPYFHDIEVHFFKQCGVSKPKVSKMSWKKLLLFLLIGGVGVYAAAFAFLFYQQGEKGVESLPCGEVVLGTIGNLKEMITGSQKARYSSAEREIPEFDEPQSDPPRRSQYGTV